MDVAWDFLHQWQTLTIVSAIVLTIQGLAFYSAYHSLRFVRTSQAAVAWTIALVTIPFLTLPLYWVFARHRFEGYREAIREVGQRHRRSVAAVERELTTERYARTTDQLSSLQQVADILDTPTSSAEQFKLLVNGREFFDAVFDAISGAEHYIYLHFYIIRDDKIGNRLAESLMEKANRGVKVRFLYDEVGCLRLSSAYLSRLSRAGVDVRAFNTRQGWVNRFQINFRNHRKLVVVDGRTAIVGGLNIGDEYVSDSNDRNGWRDTAAMVTGQVTRKVQAVFAGDYYWAAREDLPEANWATGTGDNGDQHVENVAVCATGPSDIRPRASMMFAAAASSARKRFWISSPYLVPDESSMIALHMAKARGLDVRVLIPAKVDHLGVYLAGFHYESELLDAGIAVYRYPGGFMHQKCVLVDDELAIIGSTNLDNRSLYLNFELMLAISDRRFVGEVGSMLESDFRAASPSNNTDSRTKRWWFERAGTAVARLFSPVL